MFYLSLRFIITRFSGCKRLCFPLSLYSFFRLKFNNTFLQTIGGKKGSLSACLFSQYFLPPFASSFPTYKYHLLCCKYKYYCCIRKYGWLQVVFSQVCFSFSAAFIPFGAYGSVEISLFFPLLFDTESLPLPAPLL